MPRAFSSLIELTIVGGSQRSSRAVIFVSLVASPHNPRKVHMHLSLVSSIWQNSRTGS